MSICVYDYMSFSVHVCMYIHIYIYICRCVWVGVYIYIYMRVAVYLYIRVDVRGYLSSFVNYLLSRDLFLHAYVFTSINKRVHTNDYWTLD